MRSSAASEPFTDRDELERQAMEEPAWLLSAATAETSVKDCDIWKAPAAEPGVAEPVRSAVPTLVLAGRFDPITPPEWGRGVFLDDPTAEPAPDCVGSLGPPEFVLPA